MPSSFSHQNNRNIKSYVTAGKVKSCLATNVHPTKIGKLATQSGFRSRKSAFSPCAYVNALLTVVGGSNNLSFAAIAREYNLVSGQGIRNKPFHNKLKTDGHLNFITALYNGVVAGFSKRYLPQPGVNLLNTLKQSGLDIEDIVAVDGTYWHVKGELASIYKGKRTALQPQIISNTYETDGASAQQAVKNAQLGLYTTYSLVSGFIKECTLSAGNADERQQVHPDLHHPQLIIMDCGYTDYQLFATIDNSGSYFLTKGRANMSGTITQCTINGKREPCLENKELNSKEVRQYKPLSKADFTVYLPQIKRYCRVIRIYSAKRQQVTFLMTNIPTPKLTADKVAALYKTRWQIEILFKALKSGVNLRGIKTRFINIVHAMFIVSMLCALLKHMVYIFLEQTLTKISLLKIYLSKTSWWKDFVSYYLSGKMQQLGNLMKRLMQSGDGYSRSPISKERKEQLKSFDAVILKIASTGSETDTGNTFMHA